MIWWGGVFLSSFMSAWFFFYAIKAALTKKDTEAKGSMLAAMLFFVGIFFCTTRAGEHAAIGAGFSSRAEQQEAFAHGVTNGEQWRLERQIAQQSLERQMADLTVQAEQLKKVNEEKRKFEQEKQALACASNPTCLTFEQLSDAHLACIDAIENSARYQFEWTDGWLHSKFNGGEVKLGPLVMLTGDKIKMQNGFGAWRKYTYRCSYDLESRSVKLDIQ